jgi:hypothetical protein
LAKAALDQEAWRGSMNGVAQRGARTAWAKQDRHGTQSAQRSRHRKIAGPRLHQYGDWLPAPNPATDQTPNDVVDSAIRLCVGERAPFPKEEGALWIGSGLLGEGEPQAYPCVRPHLLEHTEARNLPTEAVELLAKVRRRPAESLPPSTHRTDDSAIEELNIEVDLVEVRFLRLFERRRGLDRRWLGAGSFAPANPARDAGPGKRHGLSADDEPEVPRTHRHFEELCVGGGAADGANRGFVGDGVPFANEEHHGTSDVRERDGAAVHDEAPGQHSIMNDELVDELLEGWPGPGDEPFTAEKASARLAFLERLPVVQLPDEVHELADYRALSELEQATGDRVLDVGEVAVNVDGTSKRH